MYENYKDLAKRIRKDCLHMVHVGQSGHIGSMLSAADMMAVLYGGGFVKVDPKNPKAPDRDRFILSKGHAGAVVYATLTELGFFPKEWMDTYYCDNGKLMGHISHYVPGVEYSTGSLGHGLNVCVGMALAAKEKGEKHKIYCMMSDGDCNEGSTWEAFLFAGQHHLENLIAIVDYNRIQALGFSKDICDLGDFASKVATFGWATKTVDGHDFMDLENTFKSLPLEAGKPTFIVANTIKGKGVSFLENTVASHYWHLTEEQKLEAYRELGVEE
ncbi:MAG: transketolase [Clostridia bacterium]|nr:transketolase [Clostridia bacterium]MBQ2998852.1 transketolase [Clostridia bacterium]